MKVHENFERLSPKQTPLAVLAQGCFGELDSKTATGVIRYGDWPIVAVIDSTQAGKTVREVTGIACDAPVVATFDEALKLGPKALLLGTAPTGGKLPASWRQIIKEAIQKKLHIVSGLHTFLKSDPDFSRLAAENNVLLWDVRDNDQAPIVAEQKKRPAGTKVITLVGSDCAVGKMCAALELHKASKEAGRKSHFIATGQTGILISGSGVPLDRVIGDFMAGHVEREIFRAIESDSPEWIFVEGQGSLLHPGYSGVTIALLHGSNPDALVLCHNPKNDHIVDYEVPLPSMTELIDIHERTASWTRGMQRKAKVVGISLNTSAFSEEEAKQIVERTQAETGIPTTDPVRFGVKPIIDALKKSLSETAAV